LNLSHEGGDPQLQLRAILEGDEMASSVIQDGQTVRIALRKPWWRFLFALPVLAGGVFFFWLLAMLLVDLFTVRANGNIVFVAMPILLLMGLALTSLSGIIFATRSLLVDKSNGRVSRVYHLGPLRWRRDREAPAFDAVSVIWEPDSDNRGGSYVVALARAKTIIERVDAFAKLAPANELARVVGKALGISARDESDVEPDDPDLIDTAEPEPGDNASTPKRASRARKPKRYSLDDISISKGKVSVLLPAPAYAPLIQFPVLVMNCLIWWLDGHAITALFNAASYGLSWRMLLLAPITVVVGAPLLAMAGLEQRLVLDKAAHEFALVWKSAILNTRRPSPLSSLASLTIEPRRPHGLANLFSFLFDSPSQKAGDYPFAVHFVAAPGSNPRPLGKFPSKDLARGFADAIADPTGLRVVDASTRG